MKLLSLALLFLLIAGQPASGQPGRFIEDISGVIRIRPGTLENRDGALVLGDCAVSLQGGSQGKIGELIIAGEQPGKIASLTIRQASFPGLSFDSAHFENMEGDFAALAPALPLLLDMQLAALSSPEEAARGLPFLRAFLPALKKFHVDRLVVNGAAVIEAGSSLGIDRLAYADLGFASAGPVEIHDVRLRHRGQMILSIAEISAARIACPDIERLMDLYPGTPDSASGVSLSELLRAFDASINNLLFKNARVPMLGASLEQASLNLLSQDGRINADFQFQDLRVPGFLLALAGLENMPAAVNGHGRYRLKAVLDESGFAADQKFSLGAADLFELSGRGMIEGGPDLGKKGWRLSKVNLDFRNYGMLNCLPQRLRQDISGTVRKEAPALAQIVDSLLAGSASSLKISLEDSDRPASLRIEAE